MHNSEERPGQRPTIVVLLALLLVAGIATIAAGTAHAGQFKMVACAGNSGTPPYTTATNTVSAQHPSGIFDFNNWCGGAGGDPPGDAAFMRISEHEPSGNAGYGAYGRIVFETPWYVHFKSGGGYTRQPNAFNAGWLARFWVTDFSSQNTVLMNQGSGLPNSGRDWAASGIFGPHLWPFGSYMDFHHFYFELMCNLPGGCDRANYNATDANAFVFILNDDSDSELYLTSTSSSLLQGAWVRGQQWMSWYVHDSGSGLRNERVWIDGAQRHLIDYQAMGQCDLTSSQTNGEFSRSYRPCPPGPFDHSWVLDTASLDDGSHSLSVCSQDYGQYQGLNGTGGQTCDSRTIRVDNHAPGAPAGLQITSANPARYLDRFGAQYSLPPDAGSPIAKVHYEVINAAGEVVKPEQALAGTNPTQIADIEGPARPGDYRLRVWLEDGVGLSGPATTVAIPHDTTPPAAPQDISVTPPAASRAADGFDVRWRNVPDAGSPVDAAHYRVLSGAGEVVVPASATEGSDLQAIEGLDTPRQRGDFTLQLWLSDEEGNVGAPVRAPLSYECVRAEAGGGTTLSAAISPGGKPSVIVPQGTGTSLDGKLAGPAGSGVANAPLCVFSRVITDSAAEFFGIAVTGADGSYRFAIPAGASRELSVLYRSGHREISASAQAATRVKPSFKVRRKVIRNGQVAHFEGWIPGPHNDRVIAVLQVKRGNGWLAFRRYRTRGDGRLNVGYRFNLTRRPTLYEMRLQVREQSGYPYLQGTSEPLKLVVLPARHGRR